MIEIEDSFFLKLHQQILEDTYNDYLSSPKKERVVLARQIGRTVGGLVRNSGMSLDVWREKFKNHPLVLKEIEE